VGTTSSAIFTGSSAYSTDFQNVIDRAVAIASLPMNQLNNDKATLTNQVTELQTVDSRFAAIQTAIQNISAALDGSSFEATSSNDTVAAVSVSTGAMEGNYSIQVNDIGAYPTSLTTSAWNAAPGSPHTYQLCIGANQYDFTPSDNSAAGVAAALNAQFGGQVRATVVNVGSTSIPDYRISLQGTDLADTPLDIQDGGVSLQTAQTEGRRAQYIVNGSGNVVSSDSRNVSIAAGLTIGLVSSSGTPVDITVTRSSSALSDALSSFATAFNSAVDEVTAQRGQNAGPLQGQSLVNQLSQVLSGMATYSSSGTGISGLADLGLTLGLDGKLTFSSLAMMASDLTNSTAVTTFLGTTDGGGFLKAATDALNGLEDPTSGAIKTTESAFNSQIAGLTSQIADKQSQVDALQTQLTSQMAAADALIASMEQQYSYITSMFQAMQTADQQYS
jgi:flagellar hook-associated protein 2